VTGFNKPVSGIGGYVLPATQHDVVIWLTGASYDVVFDLSHAIVRGLGGCATLVDETVGWPYHHDLDATGFIDGTENPTLVEAPEVVLVPEGNPGAGGTILLLQKWGHDAAEWEGLPVAEQERVIGRTKLDSVELDDKPADSHVARTDQDTFGKIFRRNIGYGSLGRHGTIFVGFSRDRQRLDAMLDSMIGRRGAGHDRLTDFTHPITGAYYFVPSSESLAAFATVAAV